MTRLSSTLEHLSLFLDRAKTGFKVESVAMPVAGDWQLSNGALSHASGGFFDLVGVEFAGAPGQGQVLLYQPQSALTGLLVKHIEDELCVLVQARAEPGTFGIAQFGPTVQSTPANYLMLHGGKATPYVDAFFTYRPDIRPFGDTIQLDLGERYLMKSKRHMLAECHADLVLQPNHSWVPARVVKQALLQTAYFNIDLRSLLAVMPWSAEANQGLSPESAEVRASLAAPLRPDVIGATLTCLACPAAKTRFVDIGQLENWELNPWGLFERESRQGFDVQFFDVQVLGREVAGWIQPLINSRGPGHAVLYCRRERGLFEVLVGIGMEPGLSTGAALLPSFLRYPGRSVPTFSAFPETPANLAGASTLASTFESDEGGRFYRDTSQYELILLPDGFAERLHGQAQWLRIAELKALLASSNLCSIQLRGLASMLLGIE